MNICKVLTIVVGFCCLSAMVKAQDKYPSNQTRSQLGLEYMNPKAADRDIQTVNLNAFFWTKYFKKILLDINFGSTITYAWGNILLHENNPAKVWNHNAAVGIGIIGKLQLTVVRIGDLTVNGIVCEGPVLYSSRFPYGASYYNFMFRAGPDVVYRLNKQFAVSAGFRFMHVSNAQKTEHRNPSYEALGVNLSLVKYW
jgi:hypothetical protein